MEAKTDLVPKEIPLEHTTFKDLWRYREMIREQYDMLAAETCLADEARARGVLSLLDYIGEIDERITAKDAEGPADVLIHARVLAYRLALPPSAQSDHTTLAEKLVAGLELFAT